MRKLRAAQDIGEPMHTAVWDDLVSARAEAVMRNQSPSILPGKLERRHLNVSHPEAEHPTS